MIQRVITFLLIAMFAGQTVASAFDAHQSHQVEGVHVNVDESHNSHEEHQIQTNGQQLLAEANADSSSNSPNTNYDCHHCCHCHGSTPVYTLLKDSYYYPYNRDVQAVRIAVNFSSIATSPEHRPPIA